MCIEVLSCTNSRHWQAAEVSSLWDPSDPEEPLPAQVAPPAQAMDAQAGQRHKPPLSFPRQGPSGRSGPVRRRRLPLRLLKGFFQGTHAPRFTETAVPRYCVGEGNPGFLSQGFTSAPFLSTVVMSSTDSPGRPSRASRSLRKQGGHR